MRSRNKGRVSVIYIYIMVIQDWVDVLVVSLQNLWLTVVGFLPALLGAVIVFIIGLIVAFGLEKLVERVIYYLRIDVLLRKVGLETYLRRAKLDLNTGHFFGKVVYWFMVLAFLLASSDILGFSSLSMFLRDVLNYIPHVVIAALILLAAFVVANFLRGLVRASVLSAELHAAKTLSTIAWWGVILFGFLAAIQELGVAVMIVNTLVTGFIAMLAIAGGLAFGLGGRDHADQFIGKIRDEISHNGK